MSSKFADKSAKVVAIEGSGAARQLLTEVIKAVGFSEVKGLGSVKECIEYMETEEVDWIIAPLENESKENGLSLLKVITANQDLKSIRVSLLLEESETEVLYPAFELGCMSWHKKPFTKDSLEEEINKLIENLEQAEWNETLVAAEYLRNEFREKEDHKAWASFEKAMIDVFPGNASVLVKLAEAQFLQGDKDQGKAALKQALMLDPAAEEAVKAVQEEHMEGEELDGGEDGGFNALGIENVIVVDPDSTIQTAMTDIFKEMGVDKVECFDNGDEAAEHIKNNPDPGLIVQEWKIPKLTGPLFLQRIQVEGAPTTPVILLSSQVGKDDMHLIREMGVAEIVTKPFDKTEFTKSVVYLLQQDRTPTEQGAMERKIRTLLKNKELAEAKDLVANFIKDDTIPEARRLLIEGEYCFLSQDYERSRDCCVESIKIAGDSIHALNLLGKTLIMLQDFESALKCMKKAQNLSPLNIERVCKMAEAHQEMGNEEEAKEALEEASEIDPDSPTVDEAKVNVAMAAGDTEGAKSIMEGMDNIDGLVGYMNNKAVALSKCDMFDEGIDQYRKAIDSIPAAQEDLRSRVYYNLALAFARSSELEEAQKHVELALNNPSKKIKGKAESLKKRLSQALDTGGDFQLTATKSEPEKKVSATNKLLVGQLMPLKGEIACFLIFTDPNEKSELTKKLLEADPVFTKRDGSEQPAEENEATEETEDEDTSEESSEGDEDQELMDEEEEAEAS